MRILRRRGDLIISETRHGFVCANAGVDLSNVDDGWAALLPVDSDRSARRIRDALRATRGVEVGVVVSDTFGRPWRQGLTDVAIGVAGLAAVVDLRGTDDALGRELQVTEVAVADEVAAAAELVMGKSAGVPVAIVRGLDPTWFRESTSPSWSAHPPRTSSGDPAARLRRTNSHGCRGDATCEGSGVSRVPAFLEARRSIRAFLDEPVPRDVLDGFIEAACTAPAPHHSRPWRWVIVDSAVAKQQLADGMGDAWRRDLEGDDVPAARVDELVDASHAKITGSPAVVLGCLTWHGLDRYPDEARQRAEFGMALLSLGAAVENFMVAAADAGVRVVLGGGPHLLPRGRPRRARPRPGVAAARDGRDRPTRPRLRGRPRPPIPLDELRAFR